MDIELDEDAMMEDDACVAARQEIDRRKLERAFQVYGRIREVKDENLRLILESLCERIELLENLE